MQFWGFAAIGRWPIERLPADVLVSFWSEIDRRKANEINKLNHVAAISLALEMADREKTTALNYSKWLPYEITDKNVLTISKEIAKELIRLREADELPQGMLRDLYTNKLISPGD